MTTEKKFHGFANSISKRIESNDLEFLRFTSAHGVSINDVASR